MLQCCLYGTLVLPLLLCVRLFDRLSFSSRVSSVAAPSSLSLHHPLPLLLFFPGVIQWPPLLLFSVIIIGHHYISIPSYHAWVYYLQFLRRPLIIFLGTILDRPSFFSLVSFIEWSNVNQHGSGVRVIWLGLVEGVGTMDKTYQECSML